MNLFVSISLFKSSSPAYWSNKLHKVRKATTVDRYLIGQFEHVRGQIGEGCVFFRKPREGEKFSFLNEASDWLEMIFSFINNHLIVLIYNLAFRLIQLFDRHPIVIRPSVERSGRPEQKGSIKKNQNRS